MKDRTNNEGKPRCQRVQVKSSVIKATIKHKCVWTQAVEEEPMLGTEDGNEHNDHAVKATKDEYIVRYVLLVYL